MATQNLIFNYKINFQHPADISIHYNNVIVEWTSLPNCIKV